MSTGPRLETECAESYLSAERTPALRCCSVTYTETQTPRSHNRTVARQLFHQSRSYSMLVFLDYHQIKREIFFNSQNLHNTKNLGQRISVSVDPVQEIVG